MSETTVGDQWLPVYTARRQREAGRSYLVDAEGKRLPSVTTILNATRPRANRQKLQRWRERLGAEAATEITQTASRRGTQTHKYLRHYLLGQPKPHPATVQPYWQSLEPVLVDIDRVRLVEGHVFHYELGYAGKVDCIASYQGVPALVDWKTADQPRKEVARLYDAPLQLAAYCSAANSAYTQQGLNLAQAMLVVAIPDQPAEIFWFTTVALEEYWQQWLARLRQFQRFAGVRI